MFQGFYNLTSEMLSQTRNMNVISNNMANVSTTGFKKDTFDKITFREEIISRYQGYNDPSPRKLGTMAMVLTADEAVTDYTTGAVVASDSPLDFAIDGNGFFCIQTDGGTVYTRNGSFSIDEEGYLTLPAAGRVLGENGPIQLPSDDIYADGYGNIYSGDGTEMYGTLVTVDFEDYQTSLLKNVSGTFTSLEEGNRVQSAVKWKAKESSNVSPMEQMTAMMSGQRALQSAAQVLKMYDRLMDRTVTQLGPV